MERIFEQTLLYDFYGELLTGHQQEVYENAVYHDMSLSELAQEHGVSRQAAHDLLKRCDKILQDYESKLHLVERFLTAREKVREIEALTKLDSCPGAEKQSENWDGEAVLPVADRMARIRELAQELIKEF